MRATFARPAVGGDSYTGVRFRQHRGSQRSPWPELIQPGLGLAFLGECAAMMRGECDDCPIHDCFFFVYRDFRLFGAARLRCEARGGGSARAGCAGAGDASTHTRTLAPGFSIRCLISRPESPAPIGGELS